MYKKTIILSNDNDNSRGILTLTYDNNVCGKLRLYNLKTLPAKCKLGIYIDGTVNFTTLKKDYDCYTFSFDSNIDIKKDLYVAIIEMIDKEKLVILKGGSYDCYFQEEDETEDETEKDNLENDIIIESSSTDKCLNCPYKQQFYSDPIKLGVEIDNNTNTIQNNIPNKENSIKTNNNEQVKNEIDTKNLNLNSQILAQDKDDKNNIEQDESKEKLNTNSFYDTIKNEFDEMCSIYPFDDKITSLIPNSKFIKIADEDNSHYILGVIIEDNIYKYLVYGVPRKYNEDPPEEFKDNYQWLPINSSDPLSDGYFLIFQNTSNGNVVNMQIQ